MNILIIGSGGREHAICWKVAQSPHVTKIWVASGNAGTASEPKTTNIDIAPTAIQQLVAFAKNNHIALVIVGPEASIASGLCDALKIAQIPCIGPSQAAAQLESSKSFCKYFLEKYNIPTARFATFENIKPALDYLQQQTFPIVIKADGLAAGKGVVIAENQEQATQALTAMLCDQHFGAAGSRVVIEEYLVGEELSFICIVSDQQILPLASSQDHKRRDDGNQGPNTGGMGAYSPAPLLTPALTDTIMKDIMYPTIQGLSALGTPYLGFLYAGLMITDEGPKVLEFNCRLGDPETQPILFRLKSDLVDLCLSAIHHRLDQTKLVWDPRPALTVVLASGGYPDDYENGHEIDGLEKPLLKNTKIFHAGTALNHKKVVTSGGRVLGITALGDTLNMARDSAYKIANNITWPGRFFRSDIGHNALE